MCTPLTPLRSQVGPSSREPHLRQPIGPALLCLLFSTDYDSSAVYTDATETFPTVVPFPRDMHQRGKVVYPRSRQAIQPDWFGAFPALAPGEFYDGCVTADTRSELRIRS